MAASLVQANRSTEVYQADAAAIHISDATFEGVPTQNHAKDTPPQCRTLLSQSFPDMMYYVVYPHVKIGVGACLQISVIEVVPAPGVLSPGQVPGQSILALDED